ncbi:4,5-DOPA dioxygenase extradiol [Phytophthora citrophthora]|uniref:4,5-DOPA dioxygenase extradiol n=1 Tax=Phytophthora citrophthora TaxID=4793 RepID=A0AAD9LUL6_9STRA|nr:4,5-DOPA dioxygenase extradiol [Phytophthora citrophthora]
MPAFRHPVVAVSHGPGGLWLLSSEILSMSKSCQSAKTLQSLFEKLYPDGKHLPKRILVVSAHFEAFSGGFEISKAAKPDMIFDYYNLPAEAYAVNCPAEGDPEFAWKLEASLARNNIKAKLVDRGFDHGVFVPMLLIRPRFDIPIVSMSINSQLDSKAHFELGRVLAAFRDEGR